MTLPGFSARLCEPRVAPIGANGRTAAQEKMLASRPDFNIYKTLAHQQYVTLFCLLRSVGVCWWASVL